VGRWWEERELVLLFIVYGGGKRKSIIKKAARETMTASTTDKELSPTTTAGTPLSPIISPSLLSCDLANMAKDAQMVLGELCFELPHFY
jgi:hypothetical protein